MSLDADYKGLEADVNILTSRMSGVEHCLTKIEARVAEQERLHSREYLHWIEIEDTCERCKRVKAMHSHYTKGITLRLCCRCHVESGGTPADWHPECMQVYVTLKRAAESATREYLKLVEKGTL